MTQRLFCTDDPQGVNQRRNQSNPGVRFEICPEQPIQYQSQQMGEVRNNNQRNGDLRTPCSSLYNDFIEEDGAQIVDIAPCPDPQFHRGPTVTLNVVPLNQQFRDKNNNDECRQLIREREERWRNRIVAADNIIPPDYVCPHLDTSPLDDAVLMSYMDNDHFEVLVDHSAVLLHDFALPADFYGDVEELFNCCDKR
ncbi:uncharacterized protein LOC126884796 isoform X2 [Diabrotica virgifera virgifera]|uniref:Uncharacterized protein n=1 Tax=Diabrotica virgifera virgifera TaxID=50390 RepID=A0ABM5K9X3_DIAVI|nr:uncharacterized protein LOC126884796 isoform X1 [Diabrotica virgifera virgifera]XP_050506990.1 uncharacterized protein LOC126884796 isoform X2 [Diabrotica virgifera virgifera]